MTAIRTPLAVLCATALLAAAPAQAGDQRIIERAVVGAATAILSDAMRHHGARGNSGRVQQSGHGNRAGLRQSGHGNTARVHQQGTGHRAQVTQRGNNNNLYMFQFGRGTTAQATQTGGQTGVVVTMGF